MDRTGHSLGDEKLKEVPVAQPGNWAGIASIMQEVDRAKITDSKEDIDTLLVFAGLFSAVMTAFIIESYKLLSEDMMQVAALALQDIRLELKSFRISGGFANSTYPVDDSPSTPFQPSTAAVQVNILWFSSLILSLITVSFGILVKQWLREYTSGNFVSPQVQLRVRHFRYPGLETWKVFEIAALLPFLLQVSLGLFFLGLCIFTWSIHRTIGYASCTLVLGWLIFFFLTTISPLFFSRCPYKMLFLKRALAYIHDRVRKKIHQWMMGGHTFYGLGHIRERISRSCRQGWDKIRLLKLGSIITTVRLSLSAQPFTEVDARESDERDREILLAVDAFLTDDLLLHTTLWDSFMQLGTTPSDAVTFVLQTIEHRTGIPWQYQEPESNIRAHVGLRRLSNKSLRVTTSLLADVLRRYHDGIPRWGIPFEQHSEDHWWIFTAVQTICTHSHRDIPRDHIKSICQLIPRLSNNTRNAVIDILSSRVFYIGQTGPKIDVSRSLPMTDSELMGRLEDISGSSYQFNYSELLSCAAILPKKASLPEIAHSLSDLIISSIGDADTWNMAAILMGSGLRVFAHNETLLGNTGAEVIQYLFRSYIHCICKSKRRFWEHVGSARIVATLLKDQRCIGVVWEILLEYTEEYQRVHKVNPAIPIFWEHVGSSLGNILRTLGTEAEISSMTTVPGSIQQWLEKESSASFPTTSDMMKLCIFITHAARATVRALEAAPSFDPAWYALSCTLAQALRASRRSDNNEEAMLHSCLHAIDFVSRRVNVAHRYYRPKAYARWLMDFDPQQTYFCDDLVETLVGRCNVYAVIACPTPENPWQGRLVKEMFRVRKIIEMNQRQGT